MNYYNEWDKYAAQWLRNLIHERLIPDGHVDDRSITDVQPSDLDGYTQCHFFAGIAGWSYALQLAGWPEDREIWTGSCPCQPFSQAGKGAGSDDSRHLWPDFFRLIRARTPDVVVGEQVAAAVGKDWLDGVLDDLESIGYAGGAAVVPACAVNAPHRRDRLWFVAESARVRRDRAVDHSLREGLERHTGDGNATDEWSLSNRPVATTSSGLQTRNHWHSAEWVAGHDGKVRRVKPGIRLLAHGVPARVGKLRSYGNAIVPPLAAELIAAYMEQH